MSQTTQRVLRLLALLQSGSVWTGSQLAQRLEVTPRCIRRDVERLRELGYPVQAAQGVGGGYRLAAGKALPPLLLEDEEAVAVAVSLRLAAGGTVAGASEAALRTLAKLDAVTPPRLRAEIRAITGATETILGGGTTVDGDVLLRLARACRDTVRVRFSYGARSGAETERVVEPYRLVATGRRWYLMSWDVDRADWRTFRLDRMSDVTPTTLRFPPRDHPDPAAYVQRAVTSGPYRHQAVVRVFAHAATVRDRVSVGSAQVEEETDTTCILRAGADSADALAGHLALLGLDLEVLQPPEVQEAVVRLGHKMILAGRGTSS